MIMQRNSIEHWWTQVWPPKKMFMCKNLFMLRKFSITSPLLQKEIQFLKHFNSVALRGMNTRLLKNILLTLSGVPHRRSISLFFQPSRQSLSKSSSSSSFSSSFSSYPNPLPPSPSPSSQTRKIDVNDPNFRSLFTPELEILSAIFRRYDHELRIAGGAVRDILMGRRPDDVDFATTATPSEMIDIFEAEDIRVVHDRGAAHGTLMVRVNDKEVSCGGGERR